MIWLIKGSNQRQLTGQTVAVLGSSGLAEPWTHNREVHLDERSKDIPVSKLKQYIEAAQEGTFFPDRENDELTMALGNPEHPRRTRGTPGSIPWKAGFPDAGSYKCHERRKKVEQTQLQALHARVQAIEE